MSRSALSELARRHGIALSYRDLGARRIAAPQATVLKIMAALGVDAKTEEEAAAALAAHAGLKTATMRPARGAACHLPDWLLERPAWGLSAQLYELRSRRNWGIGDFADLAELCRIGAAAGADFVGINPLHSLFLADPQRCSPFSPSSRLFLNPLYLAVDRLPGFRPDMVDDAEMERLRALPAVDYGGVRELKVAALRAVWRAWQDEAGLAGELAAFRRFVAQRGEALRRHALFDALSEHFAGTGEGAGWRGWPAAFREAGSQEVEAFAVSHRDAVNFHAWLQFVADRQLAEAAEAARAAGMRIGLYLDFAVGEAPDGSASWSDPDLAMVGLSIGAPPDVFTADGQDWGLTPQSPLAMARSGFAPFRRTIDALIEHAGALRIDHAMALWQLFLVPEGGRPADGTYLRYPMQDLLRQLAQSSQANRAIIIGEDLGNVPAGFRDVMAASAILSYRILYFEQNARGFIPPQKYPRLALACLSTHDLPTLNGWWAGGDVALRRDHGLIDGKAAADQQATRRRERQALLRALVRAGTAAASELPAARGKAGDGQPPPAALHAAAHRFLALTPSLLVGVRLADLTGETEPTNLPGTVDSYPNWRLKSSVLLEDVAATDLFGIVTAAVAAERPRFS